MIKNFQQWLLLTEAEDEDILLGNFDPFKGTKKPLGADGIGTSMVEQILKLMKSVWRDQPGFLAAAEEIEKTQKVSRKNRQVFGQAVSLAFSTCQKDKTFNTQGYEGDFCTVMYDIKVSDNDNRFSDSYGLRF